MQEKIQSSRESVSKLHLRYFRLPNQVSDFYDDLVYKSEKIIVGKSIISSPHSVVFDSVTVLAAGFEIVYFELIGKWFSIGKIRNLYGTHTGYYCDIVTPPKLLDDGGFELTDLFLDLWVSPNLRHKVLDEEELQDALRNGWVTKQLYEKAEEELNKLVKIVKQGKFPPYQVRCIEKKLRI